DSHRIAQTNHDTGSTLTDKVGVGALSGNRACYPAGTGHTERHPPHRPRRGRRLIDLEMHYGAITRNAPKASYRRRGRGQWLAHGPFRPATSGRGPDGRGLGDGFWGKLWAPSR